MRRESYPSDLTDHQWAILKPLISPAKPGGHPRATERKSYTREYKLKVVLQSMQRDTTQKEMYKKFGIAISMLQSYHKEFQANAASIFKDKRDPKQKARSQGYEPGESPDDLKKIIGEPPCRTRS